MQKILTDNVWQQISPLVRKAKRKIAALAYVSSSNYLSFRKGDLLICDASDQAIRSGETSATVLEQFYNAGAEIYSCPCLHAKVLIFDRTVLIGSCNLSQSSAEILRELALLTSDTSSRSQALAFIHSIKGSSLPVDEVFLKRISKIPVSKRKSLRRTKRKNIYLGNRNWIVRTYRLNPERYKAEEPFVEAAEKEVKAKLKDPNADINWIRWTGKSTFRSLAREGDTIIEMTSERKSNRVTVSQPAAILKRQDNEKWTRFYYYEAQEDSLSWTSFQRELRKVGINRIKKNSTRELTPRDTALINVIWEK